MAIETLDPTALRELLWREKIATSDQLKAALKTTSTMSLFRKLKSMGYCTSYSHRGKYYTLADIPRYDAEGLWECRSVWFSRYGNLGETAKAFVDKEPAGVTAGELDERLHVETKQALLKLYRQERIDRQLVGGVYVYLATEAQGKRSQLLRRKSIASRELESSIAPDELSQELKAAVILFYSLLDEKQRRLYAGLEAQKLGHGGDLKIARLLGLDVHTVARGRRELFEGQAERHRTRRPGGGRKSAKKNARNN